MWIKPLAALLVFLAASPIPAQAEEHHRALPPAAGPVEVQMGFNLLNITDGGSAAEN